MTAVVFILGGFFSAGLALMARGLWHAPCGYEDHTGFNFGKLPVPEEDQEAADDMSAPISAEQAPASEEAADTKTLRFSGGNGPVAARKSAMHRAA